MKRGRSLDRGVIRAETDKRIDEGTKLQMLGEKFEEDKEKLENEIDKVQNSSISEEDKRTLINELNMAIEMLKEQYDTEVADEEERVQNELVEQLDAMQEGANESARLAKEFRDVQMEASNTDASAAADQAEEHKREFEQMKAEYLEKQELLREQAVIQQRKMRLRRLTGR